ncbi:MAG: DUF2934 domain-containing protein [Phycisphaeraceae bacterium]|nr:DUF2934 domain-containing protein [Phycisphaeraceae bacterium]
MTASRARTVTAISASGPKSADKTKSKAKTAAKPAPVKAAAPTPAALQGPTHEQIAQRAYEIWLRKGRPVGLDEQNWKDAELELSRGK